MMFFMWIALGLYCLEVHEPFWTYSFVFFAKFKTFLTIVSSNILSAMPSLFGTPMTWMLSLFLSLSSWAFSYHRQVLWISGYYYFFSLFSLFLRLDEFCLPTSSLILSFVIFCFLLCPCSEICLIFVIELSVL